MLHLALFAATCLTTTWVGIDHAFGSTGQLTDGLAYSVPLMAILLAHELGHFITAKIHRVEASLPYFVPLPFAFGTFGAVILAPRGTTDRARTLDVAIAGPLAGLAIALPVLWWGIAHSPVLPIAQMGANSEMEGNSVVYLAMKYLVHGRWLPGGGLDINMHPTALAGWVGLFVTMLNLLPVGQLDGGHVGAALLGERFELAARSIHKGLLPLWAMGNFAYLTWLSSRVGLPTEDRFDLGLKAALLPLTWMALLSLMRRLDNGRYHPALDPEPLGPRRRALGIFGLALFVLLFLPYPFRPSLETWGPDGPPKPRTTGPANLPARVPGEPPRSPRAPGDKG